MTLDADICYRALVARDRRFDGRFYTGVRTTGVFCRPVCPARTPKRENCLYFPSAAAAQTAGFRPCLRCRPEAAPGAPAWQGTASTVSRAMRLLTEGALDDASVDALAGRLGVGARHLRRLFLQHVGATPVEVAQTHRALFAKHLLDTTDLPASQVALAAGFASVRRFNAVVQRTWGRSPSALRIARTTRAAAARGNGAPRGVRIELAFRPPFDWDVLAAYLAKRAIPGVESATPDAYRRTISAGGSPGWIEVRPARDAHRLDVHVHGPDAARALVAIAARLRRLFDLEADPQAIAAHLGADRRLAPCFASRPGLRVPGAWDGFEIAVRAILGQQVSVEAATTIAGRLVERTGERFAAEGAPPELRAIFPRPETLARASLDRLGVPGTRAGALQALASAVASGRLAFDGTQSPDDVRATLEALPGVGPWTATYVALRALRDPDAFPATDLGLRRAFARLSRTSRQIDARVLERASEPWRPWRAYAAVHLWTWEASHANARRTRAAAAR